MNQLPPTPGSPPPTDMPAGWVAHWSAEHQRAYYVNVNTGETSWIMPSPAPQANQFGSGVQRKPVGGLSAQQQQQNFQQQNTMQFAPPPGQSPYSPPYSPQPQQGNGSYFAPPNQHQNGPPYHANSPQPYHPNQGTEKYQSQQQSHHAQGSMAPPQQFSPPPTPGYQHPQPQQHNGFNSPPSFHGQQPPQQRNVTQQPTYYPPPPGHAAYNPQQFSPPITPGSYQHPSQTNFSQHDTKAPHYQAGQAQQLQYPNSSGPVQPNPAANRKQSSGMMGKIGSKFGALKNTAGPGSTASPLKKWGTRAALGIGAIGALALGVDGMDGSIFDGASGFDGSGIGDAASAQEAVDANYVQHALEAQGQENALMLLDPPGTTYTVVQGNSLI